MLARRCRLGPTANCQRLIAEGRPLSTLDTVPSQSETQITTILNNEMRIGEPERDSVATTQRGIDTRAMDSQTIADHSSASSVVEEEMPGTSATRSTPASVSAGIAAASVHSPNKFQPARSAGEDGGSLAEMAQRDLDAALQLLAERAQYITAASGAAIALRRGEHNDMICRACAGSNAPELGALLSMQYGLSGESVRTRQVLRCDEAERDPRVNREVCRQLGIASVVVMPIVSEEQVFGVFELLSGKPRAFDERDLSALQRLSQMVETAVKHAVAAQTMAVQEPISAEPPASASEIAIEVVEVEAPVKVEEPVGAEPTVTAIGPVVASAPPETGVPENELANKESAKLEPAVKKPVFWSAALRSAASAEPADAGSTVPPGLRNLQKCQACGFPVSQGRTFCVECEEKQWRGQRLPQPTAVAKQAHAQAGNARTTTEDASTSSVPKSSISERTSGKSVVVTQDPPAVAALSATNVSPDRKRSQQSVVEDSVASDDSVPFLSSAVKSESWFAANKYILGALLVVALVLAAVAWLRGAF